MSWGTHAKWDPLSPWVCQLVYTLKPLLLLSSSLVTNGPRLPLGPCFACVFTNVHEFSERMRQKDKKTDESNWDWKATRTIERTQSQQMWVCLFLISALQHIFKRFIVVGGCAYLHTQTSPHSFTQPFIYRETTNTHGYRQFSVILAT